MKKIVIASQNPVKIDAARLGFQSMFPDEDFHLQGVSAPSGVRAQPMSSQETMIGAANRAKAAQKLRQDADFWVGIEGGIEAEGEELAAFAWIVIRSANLEGKSRTGTFFLPYLVAKLIRSKPMGRSVFLPVISSTGPLFMHMRSSWPWFHLGTRNYLLWSNCRGASSPQVYIGTEPDRSQFLEGFIPEQTRLDSPDKR
jgi:inosine/xanthosine triphosphatase